MLNCLFLGHARYQPAVTSLLRPWTRSHRYQAADEFWYPEELTEFYAILQFPWIGIGGKENAHLGDGKFLLPLGKGS